MEDVFYIQGTPLQKKIELIRIVKDKYGEITPCGNKKSLMDCFTEEEDGFIYLWYNLGETTATAKTFMDEVPV